MADEPLSRWDEFPQITRIWKTKRARFAASDRLRRKAEAGSFAIALMSLYVVALSIAPKFLGDLWEGAKTDSFGLISALASIFILILSVRDNARENYVRSHYMHDNARQINQIYQDYDGAIIQHGLGGAEPDHESFRCRYQEMVDKCPFNHDPIDHDRVLIEAKPETCSRWWALLFHDFRVLGDIYLIPAVLILVPIALTAASVIYLPTVKVG